MHPKIAYIVFIGFSLSVCTVPLFCQVVFKIEQELTGFHSGITPVIVYIIVGPRHGEP